MTQDNRTCFKFFRHFVRCFSCNRIMRLRPGKCGKYNKCYLCGSSDIELLTLGSDVREEFDVIDGSIINDDIIKELLK